MTNEVANSFHAEKNWREEDEIYKEGHRVLGTIFSLVVLLYLFV